MSAKEEPKTQWQDSQERWEATLRLWAIEDRGGYLAAIEHELDGPLPLNHVWPT